MGDWNRSEQEETSGSGGGSGSGLAGCVPDMQEVVAQKLREMLGLLLSRGGGSSAVS
jgi:hypothetical protein